jgi:hypothetical protein
MVETFDTASKAIEPNDDGPPLDVLRKQLIDATPFLLEVRVSLQQTTDATQTTLVLGKDINR